MKNETELWSRSAWAKSNTLSAKKKKKKKKKKKPKKERVEGISQA
jgi:hypothetical protein